MLVHRRKRPHYAVQAPLTSLIDIVFLLLVYFLLTTNFMVDEGIDVKLPQAEASRPQTQREITVYVDGRGRAFLENREVALGELFKRLQEKIGAAQDRLVVIKADRAVVLNHAVAVMDVAKAAGAGRLCLATEKGVSVMLPDTHVAPERRPANWLLRGLVALSLGVHALALGHVAGIYETEPTKFIELELRGPGTPPARSIPLPPTRRKASEPTTAQTLRLSSRIPVANPAQPPAAHRSAAVRPTVVASIAVPHLPDAGPPETIDWHGALEGEIAGSAADAAASVYGSSADYFGTVRMIIESSKLYPRTARNRQIQGRAVVRFVITTDGAVVDVALVETSRHGILDDAAPGGGKERRAVSKAAAASVQGAGTPGDLRRFRVDVNAYTRDDGRHRQDRNRMPITICVIDGQGGGIGATLIKHLKAAFGESVVCVALGTNTVATVQMLKAGANKGASGENAICRTAAEADVIVGSVAVTWANAMLGEVSPAVAAAVTSSRAVKILLPLSQENAEIVGVVNDPLPHLVQAAVERIKEVIAHV